ncbi:DUF2637 domain-containing protein [Streptomyces subrutilus]|uniref:DUF2637 domain-containing protein n=1 Tax=Streptomyces subrutilus TaxID=36818 RepID=A0A1E5PQC6_9ACTN|nr:DUF2637 domain-containing protein [Streptomyces subrutilus]OEJ31769.1 hypothetical protein BGK67_10790 [Streptomyces subrutilus]
MGLAGVGALAAAGVGALGLISSFDAVSAAAGRWGFGESWMLPVGIDMAIPVFTVANLLLIRMDMALVWVRFVPWVLTLVTCGLNIAAGQGLWAKVAHGTMPLLWVVFSEIGAHIYAVRIGAATGRRMDKIRASRWLLAFPSTFSLWRRMTLWEITSYVDALEREKERQLARADLREEYGWRWRSKTPRRERVLLRLGELAPEAAEELPEQTPEQEEPRQELKAPRKRPARSKAKKTQRTAEELLAEAREATVAWPDSAINAEAIRTHLHCSAASSRTLRDQLLADRALTRPLNPIEADTDEAAAEAPKEVAA